MSRTPLPTAKAAIGRATAALVNVRGALLAALDPSEARQERRAYDDLVRRSALPPAVTAFGVQRDVPVAMADGAALLTDVWLPERPLAGSPVVLMRTPYGRSGTAPVARAVAERGVAVVVQSCRGTFGSGGTFEPFTSEDTDGAATVAWIERQPWYPGAIVTAGASYVGHTQWAIAAAAPAAVTHQVISLSARSFRSVFRPGGGFALETMLAWVMALDRQERPRPLVAWWLLTAARRRIAEAANAVPMSGAARVATGHDIGAFNRWVDGQGAGDRWWSAPDPGIDGAGAAARIVLIAGWHDLFLTAQLADHRALVDAGRDVRLVVGAWTHVDPGAGARSVRELLTSVGVDVGGGESAAVEVEVMPDGDWLRFDAWPPPAAAVDLFMHGDRSLRPTPGSAAVVEYPYDPDDPTPMAGGRGLNPFTIGPRDQAERERRADVVTFSGDALVDALTVLGEPIVRCRFSSDGARPDLFVRLCDVDESGRSTTVTDGYVRLPAAPPGSVRDLELRMAPTAHRWHRGHRVRLQVSSGAHPLYARNPGTADPIHDFSRLVATTQRLHLDPSRPAGVTLPSAT